MYPLKKISFLGREVPVLCQNENGPCPLLAISNVLLLERRLEISSDVPAISLEDLIQLVANRLIELNPPLEDEGMRANQQQQIDSVIQILPNLQYGLDVNIKFNGVDAFEYTQELDAFNTLGVSLYHGWLVDEDDATMAQAIGSQSYNQLVEKAIAYKAAMSPMPPREKTPAADQQQIPNGDMGGATTTPKNQEQEVVVDITSLPDFHQPTNTSPIEGKAEELPPPAPVQQSDVHDANEAKTQDLLVGRLATKFFADTASQLTFHGLSKLHERMRERELAVFFRNNHFCTIFKYDGNLYLLVTDCGYQDVSQVVWEKLDMINGDTEYYDAHFTNSAPQTPPPDATQDHDADYLVALQIQRQELNEVGASMDAPNGTNNTHQSAASPDYAAMVAMSEQAREYGEQQQQQQPQQPPLYQAQVVPTEHANGGNEILINPETGAPYSEQELEWMRRQQQQFKRQAQGQPAQARRRSSSGDCIIL